MKGFFISLLVVVLIAIAGDQGARILAERRLADQVQDRLGLEEAPSVSLSGFPFLPRVIGGEISRMTISSEVLERQGVVLRDVAVELENVSFTLAEVLGGNSELRVTGGGGRASMTEADLKAAVESEVPVEVRFADGSLVVYSPDLDQEATADFAIRRGRLALVSSLPVELPSLRLPDLFVGNATYEGASIRGDRATLRLSVEPGTFQLSG